MVLNITVQKPAHTDFTPRITVIGVGGGGTNAVDNMIASNLQGVDFVVANTDAQQLVHSKAERRIQLGPHLTQGLGAGAKPEIGRAAAEEAAEELMSALEGTHMVFITAGMGGGTGTGAAPVIARMAREKGVLTVGVVTKPFTFEGARRNKSAESGIIELQQYVDTLIVIPNQNLFRVANERTGWKEAFKLADNVLYMGVKGVTDLMMAPGLVNLDFADIRTVMAEMGKAMMGTGEAEGEDRAVRAAEAAISNPLLEDTSMAGARGLLINITGGEDMTLHEVDQAANRIRQEVSEDANIIFGSAIDDNLAGKVRVSVVATGIETAYGADARRPTLVAVGNGGMVEAVSAQFGPGLGGAGGAPTMEARGALAGLTPRSMATDSGFGQGRSIPETGPIPISNRNPLRPTLLTPRPADPLTDPAVAPPAPAPAAAAGVAAAGVASAPVASAPATPMAATRAAPAVAPAAAPSSPYSVGKNLFGLMTGKGRRPTAPEPTEPQRAEPSFSPDAPVSTSQPQHNGDEALDIPAFLRRQTSH